ncbi:metallophosphoesterase [Agrobacterium sp.]|uniref:metallophosphoesterase n=1 Tax=Agrobacterium sp. TaxID=361 RepID=UPI0025BE0559|nr:metallophosphoesterase [Agrobacterium sp.]MCD4660465.1 metallophosphoesterase [Agrobacterium sp.]
MTSVHTFAIGDVHGRTDLLRALLDGISRQAACLGIVYRIVFLGDIVDRGPHSRQAMHLVAETLKQLPASRLILGNHDSFILRILDETDLPRKQALLLHWIARMGGAATLASYAFDSSDDAALDRILDVVDVDHVAILRAAERYVELDHHILVHAGVEPGVPFARQDPYKLMWIREPFLSFTGSSRKTVVHGHTPTSSLMVARCHGRIAIDTGAHNKGILSALHIHHRGSERILQAVAPVRGVVTVIDDGFLDLGGVQVAGHLHGGFAKNA